MSRARVQQTILVGDIPVTLTRKRIRHVHLRVHAPTGHVTMSAPHRIGLDTVEAFAAERLDWIRKQQQRVRSEVPVAPPGFVDGERYAVWGRDRVISVVERHGRARVTCDNERLTLFVKSGSSFDDRSRVMQAWHKSLMHQVLPPLIERWEQRLGVRLAGYYLRRMKTRWGTCNCRTREIRLNTELVTRPPELLEYVLVHELVHLIVPNHGPRFVALMDEHYPRWREARKTLNEYPAT